MKNGDPKRDHNFGNHPFLSGFPPRRFMVIDVALSWQLKEPGLGFSCLSLIRGPIFQSIKSYLHIPNTDNSPIATAYLPIIWG